MVTRSQDRKPQPAKLSAPQKREGISRLRRRVNDLETLDVNALADENYADTLDNLQKKIDHTLMEVFGADSADYQRFSIMSLDDTPIFMGEAWPSIEERRPHIKAGVASAISALRSAVSLLEEGLEETGDSAASRALRAYEGLQLHSEIARAVSQLYRDGHYANAVETSVKTLNNLVRLRSGLEFDGTQLMERVFNPTTPVIKFNNLDSQSDRDEQKGFMMLFSGVVSGLRHPRAHGFVQDSPERALEFIAFVSLLAKLLDEAK